MHLDLDFWVLHSVASSLVNTMLISTIPFVCILDLFLLIFLYIFYLVDYLFTPRVSQLGKHLLRFSVKNLQFMQKS